MKLFRFARICWMVTLTIEFNGLTDALFQTTHTHTASARLIDSSIMCGCVCMIDKRYSLQHPRHIQWIILRSYDWMMNIETKTTKNIEILIIFSRCFDSIFFSAPSMNRNHCLYLYTNKFNMKSHNSMADERRRRHNRFFCCFLLMKYKMLNHFDHTLAQQTLEPQWKLFLLYYLLSAMLLHIFIAQLWAENAKC